MTGNSKVEWKMVQVDGDQVETVLSELTEKEYEIFTIQFTGVKWAIVARKFMKESSGKTSIGFRPKP